MTFQLNRLYYLKSKQFGLHLIKWAIFLGILAALTYLKSGSIGIETAVAILLFTVVVLIDEYMRHPGKFAVENKKVILWMYLRKHLPNGMRMNGRHSRIAKFFVTVRNVKQIEYSSDVDERVGTFRIYGEIITQNRSGEYVDPYHPLEVVELMGVKSFREAKYQLQKEFPDAIFTRV